MKRKKIEGIKKKSIDIYWSELIKYLAGGKCEYCGATKYLNSHHIFSRSNHSVRWEEENGVCLCAKHHILGNWSAHKAPLDFAEWLIGIRGREWFETLRAKSKEIVADQKSFQAKKFEEIKERLHSYRLREELL